MKIEVIQGDITQLEVDAIVNAANNGLRGGGGVDGAIHRAGGPEILEACREIGYCATGEVVRTTGGRLKVKHLLHTVGPVYDKSKGESRRAKVERSDFSERSEQSDLSDSRDLEEEIVNENSHIKPQNSEQRVTNSPASHKATAGEATNKEQPTKNNEQEDHLLQNCYRNSIKLAEDYNCQSIAFPNISTGVYGFPKERAVELVAGVMKEIKGHTKLKKIIFCCFDDENYQLYKERIES